MEKSVELKEKFMDVFGLEEQDLRTYSPLTLAYLGDAVFELIVRTVLVERKNTQPEKLHKAATKIVKAETQARMIEFLKEDLTEEELAIYKRGRNAKAVTRAKNATMSEYRRATGFEALMGYLYLKGDTERMIELIHEGAKRAEVVL